MIANTEETLLIVEDIVLMRQTLEEILGEAGFKVFGAGNGQEALNLMTKVVPDIIVSDISMPIMDGLTFFHKVRERSEWMTIPFIFLTAQGDPEQVLKGKDIGAEEYLVKPIMPDELLRAIRAKLTRSRQLRLVQLRDSYEATLTMLANAIEVRDYYTRGHVERVKAYAVAIAEKIKPDETFIEDVRFGAILHDIGKIHIKESILRKTAPLTEAEWAEMQKHPTIGAEMIKDIPYLARAIAAVRYHHERWDGRGYPEGLKGKEIPLLARIVSVADAFDAMTSNRSYQPAISPRRAYQKIMEGAGTQYDPSVVRVFQKVCAEGKK